MATTVTLKPNAIDLSGSTSGTTTLQATAVAGTTTITLPAATDTLVGKATTDTLTNKTLTSPTITGGALNGTLGATTPSTVAATSITASTTLGVTGVATLTVDASISGLTVGRGGGAVSTNTAVGASALAANTTGARNTVVGTAAGATMSTADSVTAVGYGALNANTGINNTGVGEYALQANGAGANNTSLGFRSLYSNTTASNNTAVGYQAGYSNTTGATNTTIGYQAGYSIGTGSNNICIGRADVSSQNITNELTIATNLSVNYGKGSSTGFINPNGGGVYQGNNSSSWSTTSDRRLKKNIVDNTEGLDIISQIRVRNFEYRTAEEVTELPAHTVIEKTGVQLGVIAQELQAVCSDCVKEESTGVLSVDASNLTWHMVNAIKDLKALVDAQKAEFDAYKATHP